MVNTNPETGIRYSVIACDSLDPDLVDTLFYGPQARDLSYEAACAEVRAEVEREADVLEEGFEEEARIAAAEMGGFTDAEYERFVEQRIEQAWEGAHGMSRDEWIEMRMESELEHVQIEEPIIEGEYEGVKYHISWLGGAPLLWVFEGPVGYCNSLCSPCVPNAGDLDSGFELWDDLEEGDWDGKGFECYVVPRDWLRKGD